MVGIGMPESISVRVESPVLAEELVSMAERFEEIARELRNQAEVLYNGATTTLTLTMDPTPHYEGISRGE